MKVLLSAYACEPGRGSEPGVGWHWALEIEKLGHQVWVLTRKNNKAIIEQYWEKNTKPEALNFLYYDVPKWLSWWKKGGRGVHLYYFLWQFGAFLSARTNHKLINFDKVQHITFVSLRQPSFMGLLGVPFIFGPVGGGERAPYKLRKGFGIKGKVKDFVRDLVNFCVKLDPFMYVTFASAKEIYVTSEQSQRLVPSYFRNKTNVQLAIGYDDNIVEQLIITDSIKLLYVGRFEYWKGMGLGIQAFSILLKQQPDATLTMVGKGPEKKQWQSLAKKLAIAEKIIWIEWIEQAELKRLYQTHDLFIFPSLHDSGGMVILEAMSQGLPVVCLNLGGPGVIVDANCGINVDVEGLSENQVVGNLSKAILDFSSNQDTRNSLSQGALEKVKNMSWATVVSTVYNNEFK